MTQRGTSAAAKRRAASAVQWRIPGFDEPFVQDPLTFFERNELFGLIAKALDRVIEGGDKSLADIISQLDLDELSLQRIRSSGMSPDAVMAANLAGPLLRLLGDVPDLLLDVYMLALSVPKHQRPLVKEGLELIDDDTGFGIWEAFIDQNAETLKRFGMRWWEQISQAMQRIQGGDSSPTPTS